MHAARGNFYKNKLRRATHSLQQVSLFYLLTKRFRFIVHWQNCQLQSSCHRHDDSRRLCCIVSSLLRCHWFGCNWCAFGIVRVTRNIPFSTFCCNLQVQLWSVGVCSFLVFLLFWEIYCSPKNDTNSIHAYKRCKIGALYRVPHAHTCTRSSHIIYSLLFARFRLCSFACVSLCDNDLWHVTNCWNETEREREKNIVFSHRRRR